MPERWPRDLTDLSRLSLWGSVVVIGALFEAACAGDATFLLEWGRKGDAAGEFSSPIGIAVNSRNELIVTDLNNARVQRFSTTGESLGGFDLPCDKPDRRSTMIGGLVIDTADQLYLSFMSQHKIAVYQSSGERIREWGHAGSGPGEFQQPGGMVFTTPDTLLVADQCNHRVQQFSKTGEFQSEWGGYGTNAGQFDGLGTKGSRFGGPHFLAQDSRGNLYTTEGIQGRIQVFTSGGRFRTTWGRKGNALGEFGDYQFSNLPQTMGPIGILVDRFDRVWVSSLNDRVQCFDTRGNYLFAITGTGRNGGELLHPHGMAFDQQGAFYICDAGNQRIVKFAIPSPQVTPSK